MNSIAALSCFYQALSGVAELHSVDSEKQDMT